MKNTVKTLKTVLQAKRFIVTGSFVLAEYGLLNYSYVHDIDIILEEPTKETLDTIQRFMQDFPAKSTEAFLKKKEEMQRREAHAPANVKYADEYATPSCEHVGIFMYNKYMIDVFNQSVYEPTLLVNGIEYSTIPHIIMEKKQRGRIKDYLMLRDISRLFFMPHEFEVLLNDWRKHYEAGY